MSSQAKTQEHRAGFVNIIGNPNVGKSTLMNALVGEKLSIVTAKAQTTRHRIMGIVNTDDYQIVYSDTPGMLKPNYRLQEDMMKFVDAAIGDADIILYVTDVVEKSDKNIEYIQKLQKLECPVVVAINKIDISDQARVMELIGYWQETLPGAVIIPVSAKEHFNLESVLDAIVSKLPVSPPWFDKDQFTADAGCILQDLDIDHIDQLAQLLDDLLNDIIIALRHDPRRSSERRYLKTTARRFPTAAKSVSRLSRKGRTGTKSAPSST